MDGFENFKFIIGGEGGGNDVMEVLIVGQVGGKGVAGLYFGGATDDSARLGWRGAAHCCSYDMLF